MAIDFTDITKTFHPGIIWEGSDKSCTMPFIGM